MGSSRRIRFECAAKTFRALGRPERLKILESLNEGKCSVSEIVKRHKMPQAAASKHLTALKKAGLLGCESKANFRYYFIDCPGILPLLECILHKNKK